MDFEKYDDLMLVKGCDGYIDRLGNFYKVSENKNNKYYDTHNQWASEFIKQKYNIKQLKMPSIPDTMFAKATVNSPVEMLVNCLGFVYYSHDQIYRKPIIKIPNPKISNYRITEEQLDTLFEIMLINKEDTNIPIFFGEEDIDTYCDLEDAYSYIKKI